MATHLNIDIVKCEYDNVTVGELFQCDLPFFGCALENNAGYKKGAMLSTLLSVWRDATEQVRRGVYSTI